MGTAHSLSMISVLLWAAVVAAHPFHGSFAEIDWNSAGNTLEVSLRVQPEELERSLGKGQQIALETIPDERLQLWVATHFRVTDESGRVLPTLIVGREVSYDQTWLYFTVKADRSQRLMLSNTILLEVNEGQSNRLRRLWAPNGETEVLHAGSTQVLLWPGT